MYNVTCNGTESRVEDCDRFPGSSPLCGDPAMSAAGVVCVSTGTSKITLIRHVHVQVIVVSTQN